MNDERELALARVAGMEAAQKAVADEANDLANGSAHEDLKTLGALALTRIDARISTLIRLANEEIPEEDDQETVVLPEEGSLFMMMEGGRAKGPYIVRAVETRNHGKIVVFGDRADGNEGETFAYLHEILPYNPQSFEATLRDSGWERLIFMEASDDGRRLYFKMSNSRMVWFERKDLPPFVAETKPGGVVYRRGQPHTKSDWRKVP
jgi:hypothetical protein